MNPASCNQPQVFREGSNDGYGFLPSPVKLQGVCSQEHSEKMAGVWDNSSWLAFLVEGWWFQTCFYIYFLKIPPNPWGNDPILTFAYVSVGVCPKTTNQQYTSKFFFLQKCPGDSN